MQLHIASTGLYYLNSPQHNATAPHFGLLWMIVVFLSADPGLTGIETLCCAMFMLFFVLTFVAMGDVGKLYMEGLPNSVLSIIIGMLFLVFLSCKIIG